MTHNLNHDLYLPNNGQRYRKRNKKQQNSNNQPYFCPKYIAFHDTKPENNIYCKVNVMNHYERSAILRDKFEKIQREKSQLMQPMNKKQSFQNKRRNRKRKRERLELENGNKNKNRKRKRRKKSDSKHNNKRNQSDQIMDFLMNEILENAPKPNDGIESDTDNSRHFKSNNRINRKHNPFSLTNL